LKREMPRYSPENVQGWQTRFKLDTRVGVVFVGSFQYPPNVRAFEYICSKLAPRLSQSEAQAQILVAGLGSEPFAKNLPDNVQVLGTVDDLDGLLYASAVGIAPMDVAGGTSGKVVDFMLHGLTTVATPEAVQGVENSELLHVVPLDHFADMVIRLAKAWKADPHRAGPPEADSRYREIYTGSEDLDRIAREIRAQAFASRAGTEPTA